MGRVALILVFALILATGIIYTSLFESQSDSLDALSTVRQRQTAKRIAAEYASRAVKTLEDDWDWNDGFSAKNVLNETNSSINVSVSSKSSGSLFKPTEYTITSIATVPNKESSSITCTTKVVIIKQNFAQYGLFSGINQTAGPFWNGEIIDGPFHTNGRLTVSGNIGPDFFGPVSSVNGVSYNGLRHDDVFHNTTNFSADYIPMPENLGISALTLDLAYDTGNYQYIELKPNGTAVLSSYPFYSIEYQKKVGQKTVSIDDILNKNNGILYSNKDVYVKGMLKGQLTIATSKKLNAVDNITYSDDPRTNPESTDVLGLMSEGDFVVRTDLGRNHGGILVMANIYTGGTASMQNYKYVGNRDYFTVYGGRVQYELSYTVTSSTSRYYEYKKNKVKDKYGNWHYYIDPSKRYSKRKQWFQTYFTDYEVEEREILRPNNRKYRYLVITKEVRVPLTGHSGFKEKYVYDRRLQYINPPGYPITGKAQRLSIYESYSNE